MARSLTFRVSLFRDLIIIILLLTAAILATTIVGVRQSVEVLSRELIERSLDHTVLKLDTFFDPIDRILSVTSVWGSHGRLNLNDHQRIEDEFRVILMRNPQISSFLLASETGNEIMLLRDGDHWLLRRTGCVDCPEHSLLYRYAEDYDAALPEESDERYDPLTRPWFQNAIGQPAESLHWTAPYQFFTTKQPGITASIPFTSPDGMNHVAGFDVTLDEICEFTSNLAVSESGFAIILDDQRRLIGLPRRPMFENPQNWPESILKPVSEIQEPVMQQALEAFEKARSEKKTVESAADIKSMVRFEASGEAWWADAREYPLNEDQSLIVSVFIPESDLTGSLTTMRQIIGGVLIFVLLAACARAAIIARRVSQPIEELVAESNRISEGDFDFESPISSNIQEINRLTEAHDHMRDGLKALVKIERDLQIAKQIQQSTFPEVLPDIPGFEIAAWSEPADETGGDSYDVIFDDSGQKEPDPNQPRITHAVRFLLADATGHGIGPALSVTQVRAMLRVALRFTETLPEVVDTLNEQLYHDLPSNRFVTAWFGSLNPQTAMLTTCSAGQAPLLFYRHQTGTVENMDADAPPLGITASLPLDPLKPIHLEPNDVFIVLSDGLYEAMDAEHRQFGTERIMEIIQDEGGNPLEQLVRRLNREIDVFTKGYPATDDRTGVLIRRTPYEA